MSGKRSKVIAWIVLTVVVLGAFGLWWVKSAGGFSARKEPTRMEAMLARNARLMSVPAEAKELRNPVPLTPAVMTEARRHFADHCASCHGNDGSGNTEMGRNFYPKAPDMRLGGTQSLSDGEIYFIIHNGIRMSGMPAWGEESAGDRDAETWALVHFIRRLPRLSSQDLEDMEQYNPQSLAAQKEQQEEEEFLHGKTKGK